jgi:hypothetical protein
MTAFRGGIIIEELDAHILGRALIVYYNDKMTFEEDGGVYTEDYIRENLGKQFNIEYYSNILSKMTSYKRQIKLDQLI